jgi:hypothetical protein
MGISFNAGIAISIVAEFFPVESEISVQTGSVKNPRSVGMFSPLESPGKERAMKLLEAVLNWVRQALLPEPVPVPIPIPVRVNRRR